MKSSASRFKSKVGSQSSVSNNGSGHSAVVIPDKMADRHIPYIKHKGHHSLPPQLRADYVGIKGLLFRAHCLDILSNIKNDTIDLAFVDPPFNLGKNYNVPEFNDAMAIELYRGWCHTWLLELIRVLRPGGALFLYHWPLWLMDLGSWLNNQSSLEYKSWIALKMKNGFPIKGRLQPAHYGLLYYVKHGGKATFNVVRTKSPTCRHCGKLVRDYGGYRKKFERFEDEDGIPWIGLSDFWEDTRPARQDKARQNQVNELPMHIPERAILMASNPGDIVLDCFAGGGSTLHAAQTHGRLWIGSDIGNPSAALKRVATFFGIEETSTPPNKLLNCFVKLLRDGITRINVKGDDRPIIMAGQIDNVKASMDKYASKSKVLDV